MQETYKMMVEIVQASFKELTLEQLAITYQKELNPSILAESFVRSYSFIFQMASGYYGLTEQDIASHALERLDYCLQTYQQGNKFLTYYGTVLKNKFREETQALNTQKRKAVFHSSSYEVMVENGFDLVASAKEDGVNILEELQDYGLTNREIEYCLYILIGESNADIAEQMDCSIMTLCNMRKKLREKLGDLALAFQ